MESYKILSWNVNGIRAVERKKLFIPLIDGESPDILCLQELKVSKEEDFPKKFRELGYEVFISHPKEKKGYSGVAIMTKEKPISISEGFGIEKFDIEGRVLRADYKNFILFSVYFPNGQKDDDRLAYKMEFYEKFEKYLEALKKEGKNIVVCGDVNTAHEEIDLARPKNNENVSGFLKIERDWISHFLSLGWIDTLREIKGQEEGLYTWWSMRAIGARDRNVGWRIDYFYVDSGMKKSIDNAYILPDYKGSDHCPLGLDLKFD
ncbi:MAG: exodeoxyribonuclease III [Nanoarchaeota archaeon]|nr:exodeoxyribonuclease III [Nanoarchaeota archaeon]